jgi:hypothetical protein
MNPTSGAARAFWADGHFDSHGLPRFFMSEMVVESDEMSRSVKGF